MKKGTIKLLASTILQFEAGDQSVIKDGGDVYILIQSGEAGSEPEPEQKQAKETPTASQVEAPAPRAERAKPEASAPAGNGESTINKYTEKELMDVEPEEMLEMLAEVGVDPYKFPGKGTNKKHRDLLLEAWAKQGGAEVANDVADDTKPVATPPARASRAARSTQPAADAPELIEDWDTLAIDEMVLAQLFTEGDAEASAKLWEAQVVGWDTPKGLTEEKLFVKFLEDGMEDFLRDEDKLFVFKKQL